MAEAMVSSIHCMCLPFVLLLAQGCDMTEHRLFLLAYPPVGVAGEISRFRDASGLVRRPVPDERLHTTIGMAGPFAKSPRVLIARIRDRLRGCSLPSCRLVLDPIKLGKAVCRANGVQSGRDPVGHSDLKKK